MLAPLVPRYRDWDLLQRLAAEGLVAEPADVDDLAADAYDTFEKLIAFTASEPAWADIYNSRGGAWKAAQGSGLENSGYFAPYYRDRNGHAGADQKVVYQTCPEFMRQCETVCPASYPPLLKPLDLALEKVLHKAEGLMRPIVNSVTAVEPDLRAHLLTCEGQARLSVRIIKYSPDSMAATNPHVDKSALTCIIHTSDAPDAQNLVFASPWLGTPKISSFTPAHPKELGENQSCGRLAVVFPGEAFAKAGFGLLHATPHAVLPFGSDRARYSLVAFWLLQGVDLSSFNTAVPVQDDASVLRQYGSKTSGGPSPSGPA